MGGNVEKSLNFGSNLEEEVVIPVKNLNLKFSKKKGGGGGEQ